MFSELIPTEMIRDKRFLEIAAYLVPGGRMSETLESMDHKCQYCQGNGYLLAEDEHDLKYKSTCKICGGTGKMDAVINVEWKKQTRK